VLDRNVEHLSGGELQRFAIAVVAAQKADVYMIDEPSSYLDVRQRLNAAKVCVLCLCPTSCPCLAHCLPRPPLHASRPMTTWCAPPPRVPSSRQVIRELLGKEGEGHQQRYVIVVEHDLSVLDYLSDFICCLYGKPGAYGVVTLPFSVREGINIFLAGACGC
jgi:ATP-binding cassette subfamily E protein 1